MENDPQIIALAATLVIGLLFVCSYILTIAVRHLRETQREAVRFRFFQARDRLYLLAAEKAIPADGAHFAAFRAAINQLIRQSDGLAAGEFVRFANAETSNRDGWRNGLSEHAQSELLSIIGDIATAMVEVMKCNSRIMRTMLSLSERAQVREQVRQIQQLETVREMAYRTSTSSSGHASIRAPA